MPPITLYSKENCQPCKATKRVLEKHGIPYNSIDVMKTEGAVDDVRALGYEGVPVVVVGDEDHWNGFRKEKIEALAARVAG